VIYANIDNLGGGVTAWTASGRQLVQFNRQLVQLNRQLRLRVRPRAGPPRG
jgi:hypothetical protein